MMKIIKDVHIKHILTEKSKQVLIDKFDIEIKKLKLELDQLTFEQKKLNRKYKSKTNVIKEKIDQQIQIRKSQINEVEFKKTQLDILPLGSEIIEKTVETLVEVEEGASWSQLNKASSIIIKDGIVIKIKH